MWRLVEAKVFREEAPDRLAAASRLKGPDKIQDASQGGGFGRSQFCHGSDTSPPGRCRWSAAG